MLLRSARKGEISLYGNGGYTKLVLIFMGTMGSQG